MTAASKGAGSVRLIGRAHGDRVGDAGTLEEER